MFNDQYEKFSVLVFNQNSYKLWKIIKCWKKLKNKFCLIKGLTEIETKLFLKIRVFDGAGDSAK